MIYLLFNNLLSSDLNVSIFVGFKYFDQNNGRREFWSNLLLHKGFEWISDCTLVMHSSGFYQILKNDMICNLGNKNDSAMSGCVWLDWRDSTAVVIMAQENVFTEMVHDENWKCIVSNNPERCNICLISVGYASPLKKSMHITKGMAKVR